MLKGAATAELRLSAYTLLTAELRLASVKGAAKGELSAYTVLTAELRLASVKGAAKVEGELSAYTVLTAELRLASVKGAAKGELSAYSSRWKPKPKTGPWCSCLEDPLPVFRNM